MLAKRDNPTKKILIFTTSTDDIGISDTSGATAPAPPNLLMLNTCKVNDFKRKEKNKQRTLFK